MTSISSVSLFLIGTMPPFEARIYSPVKDQIYPESLESFNVMGDDENTTMNWTTSDLTSTTMTSSLNTTGSTTTTLAEEISIKVFGDVHNLNVMVEALICIIVLLILLHCITSLCSSCIIGCLRYKHTREINRMYNREQELTQARIELTEFRRKREESKKALARRKSLQDKSAKSTSKQKRQIPLDMQPVEDVTDPFE